MSSKGRGWFKDIGLVSFDFDRMREDPEFATAAEQILRMQYYYHLNHSFILDKVRRIRHRLESHREKTE